LFGGVESKPTAEVSAMAHITGGGVPGKLGRALTPSGLGAELTDLFEPCSAMKKLMEMGPVDKQEAFKTWNMGNGLLVVTSKPDAVLKQAKAFKLEAKKAGQIVQKNGIQIR